MTATVEAAVKMTEKKQVTNMVAEPVQTYGGATTATKKTLLKSTPSISSFTNPVAQKKTAESVAVLQSVESLDFSQEKLETAWKAFAERLNANKRLMDYNIFIHNNPVKISEKLVQFTVPNAMAKERLDNDKTELMVFLRKELSNYDFMLEVLVSKEEGAAMIYTSADKFKRLSEINPALQKLRQTFDLDIDY